MKKILSIRNLCWFLFLSGMATFTSCKKHSLKPKPPIGDTTVTSNRLSDEDSLKFYVWWINASDSANVPLYYWEQNIPSTFNYLNSAFPTADSVLSGAMGITSYSYSNAGGPKLDRYSFLDRSGAVASELQGGVIGDFGFQVSAVRESSTSNNIGLYILFVYLGSPAGDAGVQRGWKIASIDGASTAGLTTSSDLSTISKEIFDDATTTFTFQRIDGTNTGSISLTRATYHVNPVLFDTVYTVNSEKVGYFVYNSFVSVTSSDNGALATQEINTAFDKFKSEGVKDLIVDLRYNGGGSVDATEYLDNLMAPASANGQVMYSTKYNPQLTDYFNSSTSLSQEFPSTIKYSLASDNLNLPRMFFIVSGNTASAAELTINNLKPYMSNVYLIGDTTYGKPVGFFDISIDFVKQNTDTISHVADMYAINFQSFNKNGEGSYFNGIPPDYYYPYFNVSNWGDTSRDARLSAALNFIATGSFQRTYLRLAHPSEMRVIPDTKLQNPNEFNGMVNFRLHLNNLQIKRR